MNLRRSVSPIVALLLSLLAVPSSFAGIVSWLTADVRDWESVQRTGGIRIGEPLLREGEAVLPVVYDCSGATAVTRKPDIVNSGEAVRRVRLRRDGSRLVLQVVTSVAEKGLTSTAPDVSLRNVPPGSYDVFYGDPNDSAKKLGAIVLPPKSTAIAPAMPAEAVVENVDWTIPAEPREARRFLERRFVNGALSRRFDGFPVDGWDVNWNVSVRALVARARHQGLEAEALQRALTAVREKSGGMALLPIAAYRTTMAGEQVWAIVCKWELNPSSAPSGKRIQARFGHVRVQVFELSRNEQVAFATCL